MRGKHFAEIHRRCVKGRVAGGYDNFRRCKLAFGEKIETILKKRFANTLASPQHFQVGAVE